MVNLPPHQEAYQCPHGTWGSQQSAALLANFTPPLWQYAPSPEYVDVDGFGGFNANITFSMAWHDPLPLFIPDLCTPSPAFTTGLSTQYSYSLLICINADMNEIITNGSIVAASCPGFRMQNETMDTVVDMEDDEHADAKEEVEEEEPMEVEPSTKGRKKKKRTSNSRSGEPRVKWTPKEDECVAEAWKTINIDPITSANQNANTYWSMIKTAFDERKLVDPDFAIIYMDRGEKAMVNHWATIQLQQVAWDSREDYGSPGKRRQLQAPQYRLALAKAKNGVYNLDVPASAAAKGRLGGTKRVRTARDATPAVEWLQSSIEHCIADAKSNAAKREEKSEARSSALMIKQDVKLNLLRTNIAPKREEHRLGIPDGSRQVDDGRAGEGVVPDGTRPHLEPMATTTAPMASTEVVSTTPSTEPMPTTPSTEVVPITPMMTLTSPSPKAEEPAI
ncbi:methionyl-trna synthetase [Hordeum vulgare]|nr:methionyl-trna synthetase [Hordeum vulgare]